MDCGKTVAKSGTPIKILIGGSPCTKWSIAQKIAMSNYPDIVQCGDAFQIRNL